MPETAQKENEMLGILVAIARAARLTDDEVMERIIQRQLWQDYGIRVAFDPPEPVNGKGHGKGRRDG